MHDAHHNAPIAAVQLPDLKLFLRKSETNKYCGAEPTTNSTTPVQTAAGGWYRLTIPMSAFECGGLLSEINQFDWQNKQIRNAIVCISDVTIDR